MPLFTEDMQGVGAMLFIGVLAFGWGTGLVVGLALRRKPKRARKGQIVAPQGEDSVYRWRGVAPGGEVIVMQPMRGKGKGFIAQSQALQNGVDALIDTEWERPPELSQVKVG